jgi:hypothetical protein
MSIVNFTINPVTEQIPERYPRYRHGIHQHRLFVGFGHIALQCDACRKEIGRDETRFFCYRCNFDLCARCFCLPPFTTVPLSEDDATIDDSVLPPSLFTVSTTSYTREPVSRRSSSSDSDMDGAGPIPSSWASVPMMPTLERMCAVCTVESELLQLPCSHICCFGCYRNVTTCPVCREPIMRLLTKRIPAVPVTDANSESGSDVRY